jgi:hypothetical protein
LCITYQFIAWQYNPSLHQLQGIDHFLLHGFSHLHQGAGVVYALGDV